MKTLYTAHAIVEGGRDGHGQTDDKKLDVMLVPPGSGKDGVNPEQLFAIGYAACFGGAVAAVGKSQNATGKATIKSDVNLNKDDQGGFFLSVILDVDIEKLDDAEKLEEIILSAHHMCPYSKATRGNIEVKLKARGNPIN
ncbi:MAG TPA: Ohr family peroxiredoxin [Parachlamydiaceae bacterium]|nr:Ohr family peroxiredoxin [Parachlamydiaceae bacterium]